MWCPPRGRCRCRGSPWSIRRAATSSSRPARTANGRSRGGSPWPTPAAGWRGPTPWSGRRSAPTVRPACSRTPAAGWSTSTRTPPSSSTTAAWSSCSTTRSCWRTPRPRTCTPSSTPWSPATPSRSPPATSSCATSGASWPARNASVESGGTFGTDHSSTRSVGTARSQLRTGGLLRLAAGSLVGQEVVDRGAAAAVAAGDLVVQLVHHDLHLAPPRRHRGLLGGERLAGLVQLLVRQRRHVGQVDVGDEGLHVPAVRLGAGRLHRLVAAETGRRAHRVLRQDRDQLVHHGGAAALDSALFFR